MSPSRISRREFLTLTTIASAAAAISACAPAVTQAAPTQPPQPTQAPAATKPPQPTQAPAATQIPQPTQVPAATAAPVTVTKYQESPMLADLVKAGKLPPVEQRLPKNPMVIDGDILAQKGSVKNWIPGKYGGSMTVLHNEPSNAPDVFFIVFQQLIRPPSIISGQAPVNNIVESYSVSQDLKEYTFKIRDGLKWSDGKPVTTEDFQFTYEDVLTNTQLNPKPPAWALQNGKIFKLVVVDPLTFKCVFEAINGRFLRVLAIENWPEYSQILKPKHYLTQFHIKYTPLDKMKPALDAEKLGEDWVKLFLLKDAFQRNITSRAALGMPVLNPYVLTSIQDETYTYERNPYYFKIDKDGKQLPYIDKLVSPKVQDGEMENMKAIVGEADILRRNAALAKLPLYKENEAKGNYTTLILDYHLRAPVTLNLNLTYKDTSFRQVVNDVRFRQALSIGMNHQEIIDSVYLQQAKTPTLIPAGDDLPKANKLLDDMGMKVGSNGLRNAIDGKPFVLLIEVGASAADQVPTAELLSSQYRKNLKLDVSFKKLDTTLFNQKNTANEVQSTIFWSFDAMADDEASIRWVQFMPLWNLWRNDNTTGEEPPAWVKQGIDLDNKRMTLVYGTPEYFTQKEAEAKYFFDNIPAIPIVESSKIPLILSNKFANGPVAGYQIAGLMLVEGMYLK